jgi:hypothetical protein
VFARRVLRATVELRGGSRNVKVATKKAPVAGTAILWNETVSL